MEELWYYSSGGAGPVPPDPPPPGTANSLRFRGNQFMSRTAVTPSDATEFTLSFWVKRGELSVNQCIMYSGLDKDNKNDYISFPANDTIEVKQRRNVIDYTTQTTAAFRDPSAWYHIVYTWEDGDRTIYVNGIEQTCDPDQSTTATHYWQTAGRIIDIGRDTNNAGSPFAYFDGYLSAYYFIDGQALEPTAFGRFNDDGVWVPREVDFTPAEMRYSDFAFTDDQTSNTPNFNTTTRDFQPQYPASNGFNGSTTTACAAAFANGWAIFRPAEEITVDDKVELMTGFSSGGAIWVNNADTGKVTGGSSEWVDLGDVGGTLTNLAVKATGSTGAGWRAIKVDGEIITNPFIWSADLTSSTGGFLGPPEQAFNGIFTGEFAACSANSNAAGTTLTWAPATEIEFTTSFEAAIGLSSSATLGAGNPVNGVSQGGWVTVATGEGTVSADNTLVINTTNPGSAEPSLYGVRIDGQIYIDGVNPSYGANGFHLTFEDPDNLGLDTSGNGNNFTATEFNTDTTSPDYDAMEDGPSQNYSTLNPLDPFSSTTIDANLGITAGAAREFAPGTIAMADNSFYVELNCDQPPVNPPNRQYIVYIVPSSGVDNSTPSLSTGAYEVKVSSGTDFEVETNNAPVVAGTLSSAPGANFTMQVLYNAGTRELYCGIDNENWLRNDGTISTAFDESEPTIVLPEPASGSYTIGCNIYNGTGNINYGQQPFLYTPPAGFEALQTQNLPAAPIANGRDNFGILLWDGNNDQQREITGLEFAPDFVWIKHINGQSTHSLQDTVRGAGANSLRSDTANPAGAGAAANGFISAFRDDGFTLDRGTDPGVRVNGGTGESYVAWCWRAGGAAVTNNDGTIESQVSANTDAGFSIVSYTGETANRTVGHGLTEPPEFMIVKRTNATVNWAVYHQSLGAGSIMSLNNNATPSTGSGFWNNTPPNDDVFSIGDSGLTGTNGPYIAYCWAPVPGYSAFGSYTGNNSTDGPFIYLGFRPAFLLVKNTSRLSAWTIKDSTRNPTNPCNLSLFPNTDQNEGTGGDVDFLSNGFKIRNTAGDFGDPGDVVVYVAFAENPFGGENIAPANAR